MLALCEKLKAWLPGDFKKKTLLCYHGSEALENAVEIARGRHGALAGVDCLYGGYQRPHHDDPVH